MDINLTLFAQAASFAVFIWFTARFVWPPLSRAIEDRQKHIAEGLAAAERGKQDLEQAATKSADLTREARQQAQEILAQAEQRGAQIIEEAKIAANAEGARLITAGKAEIAQEVSRAREALRGQVAALAIKGAEQILRREVDERAHADLLAGVQNELLAA
jgi:F-type H+-transporting ATPase subunit b